MRGLARIASECGLISEEPRGAIEGLSMLRDLSVQSGLDIGADRAREYLVMADAVLYALRLEALSLITVNAVAGWLDAGAGRSRPVLARARHGLSLAWHGRAVAAVRADRVELA